MSSTSYSCVILTKTEMSRRVFEILHNQISWKSVELVFMSSTRYSCVILTKTEMSRRVFENFHNQISRKSVELERSCSMRTDWETGRHDEVNGRFSQFWEPALTWVFLLHYYTINFCPKRTKLHFRYFATDQFIFSSVDGGDTAAGTNYREPTSGRPESVANVFAFSVLSDAVR